MFVVAALRCSAAQPHTHRYTQVHSQFPIRQIATRHTLGRLPDTQGIQLQIVKFGISFAFSEKIAVFGEREREKK